MSAVVRPELIFVSRATWMHDPLEPLTHLLAGAVAQETGCFTVIVLAQGGVFTVLEWQANAFVPVAPLVAPVNADHLRNLVPNMPSWRGRVFVVNLDQPQQLPAGFDSVTPRRVRFDRIVYVTDGIPEFIPPPLAGLLANNASEFSTFIPSVIVPPKPARSPWRWPIPWGPRTPFGAREMPDKPNFMGNNPVATAARLFRDACHITIDRIALATAWPPPAGVPLIDNVGAALKRRAWRWGRAVTNRQVGVAVSGGGASAYRVAAFLEALHNNSIPVDVLAGLSGGAFVGAYYCEGGLEGLYEAADWGPLFQIALPVVMLTSWPLEFLTDVLLGTTRVRETEVRYAAVATELRRVGPPESTVVKEGTLGEAVRASGCLPPAFAPTRKNARRYTDGGAAAVVPARIIRDCGADMTIAVNAIPGARASNPLDFLPFGNLLHDWTPVGRLLDIWTWYTFMWTRISRRHGEEANVFLEFAPQQIPFVEGMCWWDAHGIIVKARNDARLGHALNDAVTAWGNLPKC